MNNFDRRRLLQFLALGAIARPANAFWFFGNKKNEERLKKQVHKLVGEVTINGVPAQESSSISPGDTIVTGEKSGIVFQQGKDAHLLRSNTAMTLESRSLSMASQSSFFRSNRCLAMGTVVPVDRS